MTDYLRIGYDSDGSGGNGYLASGLAGTPGEGLTVDGLAARCQVNAAVKRWL